MVVDDDDDFRELVVEMLHQSGYQAKGVSGGPAALEILRTATPALVLTDLFMKGMEGTDLLKHARKLDIALPPFVFMTGAVASKLEDISGAILCKPFGLDQLLDVVALHWG